jgi:hypothetical protein
MGKNKIIGALFTAYILLSSALFAEDIPSVKPNGCKGPVLCPSYPIYDINSLGCQIWERVLQVLLG